MNNFSEMVNRAIYEIKDALEHGYNFRKDFLEETFKEYFLEDIY